MIYHTENDTTVKVGESSATVIADSLSSFGARITTFELVYPRYIHAELLTHRAFSRNASSSRATPVSVNIREVEEDPVLFDAVNANRPGMQGGEHLADDDCTEFLNAWRSLGQYVAKEVKLWEKEFNIHKQVLNRALEPWLRIRTLVTATDLDNFFRLRISHDAQPEMQSLALAMFRSQDQSDPALSAYHLPYITEAEHDIGLSKQFKVSAARCARVSYARHDGKPSSLEEDLALADRLFSKRHLSPFEHQATAAVGQHANFNGWQSYRNELGV